MLCEDFDAHRGGEHCCGTAVFCVVIVLNDVLSVVGVVWLGGCVFRVGSDVTEGVGSIGCCVVPSVMGAGEYAPCEKARDEYYGPCLGGLVCGREGGHCLTERERSC